MSERSQLRTDGGVEVNGRAYRMPRQPTVVFTIDGGDPRYLDAALERNLMPRIAGLLQQGGAYARGRGQMPSLTNPNNLSIVCGVPPSWHGVPGNHYLDPAGNEVQLVDPAILRAPSIHAALRQAGAKVLAVTAKDKLRRLLGAGGVPAVSAERVAELELEEYGLRDLPSLVGQPVPGIYDGRISHYAMEIGLAVHRRVGLDLLYVSLTDYVQHTSAPGSESADRFFAELDRLLGEYLDAGFLVGITADHGMNAKQHADGSPKVLYIEDELQTAGVGECRVVLPITDPYVVHHGALGSFAWVHLREPLRERAREALARLAGIEEVYTREEAALIYEHPADRIGDLSVSSDASTALGKSRAAHDLTQLQGGLRSHGGRHEQIVPLVVSQPLRQPYARWLQAGAMNSDIHDLLLNGTE